MASKDIGLSFFAYSLWENQYFNSDTFSNSILATFTSQFYPAFWWLSIYAWEQLKIIGADSNKIKEWRISHVKILYQYTQWPFLEPFTFLKNVITCASSDTPGLKDAHTSAVMKQHIKLLSFNNSRIHVTISIKKWMQKL